MAFWPQKAKTFFSLQTFALTHKGSIPIQRDPSLCKKSDSAAVVDVDVVGKYVLAKIAQSDLLPHFYPPCLAFFCWNWHFFTPLEDSRADMKKYIFPILVPLTPPTVAAAAPHTLHIRGRLEMALVN